MRVSAIATLLTLAAFIVFSAAAPADAQTLTEISNSFERLVQKVNPSVVQIFSTGYGFTGGSTTSSLLGKQRATGSGVIVHPDGYIVTNAHVVEGATRVQVLLSVSEDRQGKSILKPKGKRIGAQVIGIDRETDLAVLRISVKNLPYLKLADSDNLRQGQIVLAFGAPLGLENSVSMGVISAVTRQLKPEDPMIYIQTDATINPGNSGGPLVDTDGNVVGINTMILSHAGGSEGIGFAAPSNIVRNVVDQFRLTGRVRRGGIGVFAQTITPTMAASLSLPRDWGVVIGDVYPGGPAEKAGLQVGDVVLSLDNKVMENGRQFKVNLYRRSVGDKVPVEIQRGTQTRTIKVSVVERDDDPARFASMVRPDKNLIPKLGVLCLDMDRRIQAMLPPMRKEGGVVVAARAADAPYSDDGLMPGDVIHALNGKTVKNLQGLKSELSKLGAAEPVTFQVERDGRLRFVAFLLD